MDDERGRDERLAICADLAVKAARDAADTIARTAHLAPGFLLATTVAMLAVRLLRAKADAFALELSDEPTYQKLVAMADGMLPSLTEKARGSMREAAEEFRRAVAEIEAMREEAHGKR